MKLQRFITSIVLTIFVFGHALSLPAFAEAPTPPPASTPPPVIQNQATPPPAATPPPTPTGPSQDQDEHDNDVEDNNNEEEQQDEGEREGTDPTPAPTATPTPKPSSQPSSIPSSSSSPTTTTSSPAPSANNPGGQTSNGNMGETNLTTGSATNGTGVLNTGNNNLALTPGSTLTSGTGIASTGPSLGVVNSDNGSGSTNNGSASVSNTNNTDQANSAVVANNVNQSTTTGDNEASKNTGGNVNLETGDANTTGTIINSLNTNVSGVAVAEFNVEDDHKGDIVLDFAGGCISGCDLLNAAKAANTGNGSGSTNSASLDTNDTNNTSQFNEADIANNMTLVADSGNNDANKNTGGDVSIETGDANVAANVLTFANNNIAGNVVYTVVNVFGELIGNIVMPKEYIESAGGCLECGGGDALAANNGNGANSTNTANLDQNTTNNTFQSNDANIENNLIIDASTAGNQVNGNTDGDNSIQTGDTNVDANVMNVANSNVAGGVWWLVLVNEAGNWVGKIVGSPDGTNMAGSEGTEFIVDENGEVMAVNSGNGSGSTNTSNVATNETNNTVQDNKINLVNNVNLKANTGGNEAKDNTGSNSTIKTGDANVVANIVNFVNNNITGGGKLFVTVVNVFGGWTGNFITPDAKPDDIAQANQNNGGQQEEELLEEETEIVEETVKEESEEDNANVNSTVKKKKKVVGRVASSEQNDEVLAANTDSGGGNKSGGVSAQIGGSLSQVAGVKIGPSLDLGDAAVVGNEKIKINLAWLVLALPLLGLIAFSRMRIAYYTRKIKNNLASKRVEGVLLGSLIAACIYILNRVS